MTSTRRAPFTVIFTDGQYSAAKPFLLRRDAIDFAEEYGGVVFDLHGQLVYQSSEHAPDAPSAVAEGIRFAHEGEAPAVRDAQQRGCLWPALGLLVGMALAAVVLECLFGAVSITIAALKVVVTLIAAGKG